MKYQDITKSKRVKTHCPRCEKEYETPIQWTETDWGIDTAKCSRCFREDFVFVNLVRSVSSLD